MLRFCGKKQIESDGLDVVVSEERILMNDNLWQEGKAYFKRAKREKIIPLQCLSIVDEKGDIICYGWQDDEANRELRMLRELRENKQALQFTDIFPDYKEVLIWGCNELATAFAEYLKELGVAVSVMGQYWNYYGYESCGWKNQIREGTYLVIYAEGIPLQNYDLHEALIRSASPEFECIDKIYEANVLEGRIQDTIGDFDEFINRLKNEREIVILGGDREAQDTYDLLMAQGIDICCFAVPGESDRMLLGKKMMSIEDAMRCFDRPVFLNHTDVHSTLGEKWTEYFDYCGYERNKQYFLVKDYTDIPTSNLVHVLHGKQVLLTGDSRLCQLLSDYLNSIENGEVTVQYIALSEKVAVEKKDILCLVIHNYKSYKELRDNTWKERQDILQKELSEMGFIDYTDYFVCSRCFALIDLYLNRDAEKYTVPELIPKGILLGRIPAYSGNEFFRGIMDGHPEVIMMQYSDINSILFYFCVRLANIPSDKVMSDFWEMYDNEAGSKERCFPRPEIFEEKTERLLSLKESFTSQELFVLFHIAYAEMIGGRQISDISKLVIYWEPHNVSRNEFPFWGLWLEDKKVNGNTLVLRRNNIVWFGSVFSRMVKKLIGSRQKAFDLMFADRFLEDDIEYQYWTEHKMRFEDIKTKPEEKLMEVCRILNIDWSDSMLRTTKEGEPRVHSGSMDFDLKPVFNQYEDYTSEFDRFRISIASSSHQKRYGYSYSSCLKFTRRELQEMFLKPFLFDEKLIFGNPAYKNDVELYERVKWKLWNIRKHTVLDDVHTEFERFELEKTGEKFINEYMQDETNKSIEYIKSHDKLILYGTGNDCLGLLKLMDESIKEKLLYSDKKAETKNYFFQGKNVISPKELCSAYKGYNILVTSSMYRRGIEFEFKNLGIDSSRVYYNRAEFNEGNK